MSQKEKDELMQLILDQSRQMTFIVEDLLVAARAEIGTVSVELVRVDLLAQVSAALEIPVFEGSIVDRDHAGGLKQAVAH